MAVQYITETRKADGSEYTPHSLYLFLLGIQWYIHKVYPRMQFNLLSDHELKPLKSLCDSVFKKLHSKGIGASLKTTAVLSSDDEKKLRDSNVLNLKTTIRLLHAVFFYNGEIFVCEVVLSRAILNIITVSERSYYSRGQEVSCYVHAEFGSKTGKEGLPI